MCFILNQYTLLQWFSLSWYLNPLRDHFCVFKDQYNFLSPLMCSMKIFAKLLFKMILDIFLPVYYIRKTVNTLVPKSFQCSWWMQMLSMLLVHLILFFLWCINTLDSDEFLYVAFNQNVYCSSSNTNSMPFHFFILQDMLFKSIDANFARDCKTHDWFFFFILCVPLDIIHTKCSIKRIVDRCNWILF